jgi:hypothetical protein
MHSQTTLTKPAGPTGKFVQYEQTEFGKEVGRDEINWWVFKKEMFSKRGIYRRRSSVTVSDFNPFAKAFFARTI